MRERPQYEICPGCGSPEVDGGGFCVSCQKLEMDAQRVESTDHAIEHGLGIEPFVPVSVPRPPMSRPPVSSPVLARQHLKYVEDVRHQVLAAANIEDYDEREVRIDRTKDERDAAWLKRALASVPGQHPKP